ncbi:MAG: hypothetical protein H6925_01115 [Holosporaceae bacterium]|nr:MAG: hypothetical protein H6925_01115 [Holosporaceae bacterium]
MQKLSAFSFWVCHASFEDAADKSITNVQHQLALGFVIRHIGQTDYLPRLEDVQTVLDSKTHAVLAVPLSTNIKIKFGSHQTCACCQNNAQARNTLCVAKIHRTNRPLNHDCAPWRKRMGASKAHVQSDLPLLPLKTLPLFGKTKLFIACLFLPFSNSKIN